MKILRQVIKYGKAYAVWLKNGKPVRSDVLVHHIFKTHCEPCEHYDPDLKECSICECSVSENHDKRNKIVWATEECPIKRWTRDDGHDSEGEPGETTDDAGGGVGEGMQAPQ